MSATYLGSMSFGSAAVGVSADVSKVLAAVQVLLGRIAQLKASLEALFDLTGSLEAAIKLQLLADIEVQLAANLDLKVEIGANITDPTLFIAGLAQGLIDLDANLKTLLPAVALDASLDANVAAAAELGAKKAAIELLLTAVGQISAVATAAVQVALAAVALPQVTAAANLAIVGAFSAPGIHVVRVASPLSTALGGEALAALAGSGLAGGDPVELVVLLVDAGNAQGAAALDLAFTS